MAKKEQYQKEIDILMEELRFFHNLLLGLISGIIGVVYALGINKLALSSFIFIILTGGFLSLIFILVKITEIKEEQMVFIEKLGEVE